MQVAKMGEAMDALFAGIEIDGSLKYEDMSALTRGPHEAEALRYQPFISPVARY